MVKYRISTKASPASNVLTVYRDGELRSFAVIGRHEWQGTAVEDKEGEWYLTVRQCPAGATVEEQVRPRKPL
jgi:hypothetical protein